MTNPVRDAYDANAELYASLFADELDQDTQSRQGLLAFAELAAQRGGLVADLGCGPGSVVDYLGGLGLPVTGFDLSSGQIAQARQAFPSRHFKVGDLTELEFADSSLGGIVSRHSLIHLPPSGLTAIFGQWLRVLQPPSPVFVSFLAHGPPTLMAPRLIMRSSPPTNCSRQPSDNSFKTLASWTLR